METKAEQALKRIAAALKRFEQNAETMKQMGMDHAYWSGRLDAIKDIKDVLEGKEGAGHGGTAHPATRPAS